MKCKRLPIQLFVCDTTSLTRVFMLIFKNAQTEPLSLNSFYINSYSLVFGYRLVFEFTGYLNTDARAALGSITSTSPS